MQIEYSTLLLEGSRNRQNGLGVFPPIPDSSPAARLYEPVTLSELGTLYSYTIIHSNPKSSLAPYIIGYVDFPENVRVFGKVELESGDTLRIGMPLRAVAVTSGEVVANYQFVHAGV